MNPLLLFLPRPFALPSMGPDPTQLPLMMMTALQSAPQAMLAQARKLGVPGVDVFSVSLDAAQRNAAAGGNALQLWMSRLNSLMTRNPLVNAQVASWNELMRTGNPMQATGVYWASLLSARTLSLGG